MDGLGGVGLAVALVVEVGVHVLVGDGVRLGGRGVGVQGLFGPPHGWLWGDGVHV